MSNKNLLVSFIVVAMAIWVLSGEFAHSTVTADPIETNNQSDEIPLVRGVKSEADRQTMFLDVRGQTRANRSVQVKAEVSGKIEALPGQKGARVSAGDLLCRIAVDARQNEYNEALAELNSARLEYNGYLDLNSKGLQSEVLLAKAKASLEQSKTMARRAELALAKTEIVAPFNGIVESQSVEVGDFLSPGSTCVTLIENDPILVVGQVAEKNIGQLSLGDQVAVELITGQALTGEVSFIGHTPETSTRTFPVEVTVSNPGAEIRVGLTSDMRVPVGAEDVHLISPASMVLSDTGRVGVRIVDAGNQVRFMPVDVVGESPQGIWVTGLPARVDLITVGQEEVFDGQLVKIDFSPITSLVSS